MTTDNIQLGLFLSAPYECSYLPHKMARSQVIVQSHWVSTPIYSVLMNEGFRRSGLSTYRPRCDQCQACLSSRIVVQEFSPSRTQRRIFNKHSKELTLEIISQPYFDPEHYALYQRYQQLRHADKAPEVSPESYEEFLVQSYVETQFLSFRDQQGILRMVSVIDCLDQGLSAVYTFYDPDYHGSLGTYAIMTLVRLCQQRQLPYVYLGYWIENSEKMHYKQNFQPLEVLQKGQWQRLIPPV